jgi:predicted metalloprotease with PDZ domain
VKRVARGLLCVTLAAAASGARSQGPLRPPTLPYDLVFEATLVPTERLARVRLRIGPNQVSRMVFRIDPERHQNLRGDGKVVVEGGSATWQPPRIGGTFRYDFRVDRLRNASAYDARISEQWAIFRGSDLFPAARVRAEEGSYSRSSLRLRVPKGWSMAVPYERAADGHFVVENEHRHFDRPTAWMALGRLGVLREKVAGASVAVAGPFRQKLRRQDILALMRWTLPSLRTVLGELPPRLLVVGAGDPMWRGGLSGPASVFIHAERPLITPDGTSPLLHELFHAVTGARAIVDGDWVVEGLAELYSVEMLVRSRTISRRRYERVLDRIAARGAGAPLLGRRSDGASTARAVSVLRELDAELRGRTEQQKNLDDVVAELTRKRQAVSTSAFRSTAEHVSGLDLGEFFRTQVEPILKRDGTGGGA